MIENKQIINNFWLKLDNAAKIYPAITSQELTSVFRISVELHERIQAKQFLEAVNEIEGRFPYYKVLLKEGVFWYYLEYKNIPVRIRVDSGVPCRNFSRRELMFRILIKENRISVEFSHVITDGTGALEFLKTLLFTYFEKRGSKLPEKIPFFHPGEPYSEEEYEDSFQKYFPGATSLYVNVPDAFHLPFILKKKPRFNLLLGIISLDLIRKKAKEYDVSLTEYLIAVYMYALQEVFYELPSDSKRRSNKMARVEVPVNLRQMYPSKTMRNFSLYVLPEIELSWGRYTFDELVKTVYHQMRLKTDTKLLNNMISRNVGGEKNPMVRAIPLMLKTFFLSKLYLQGTSKYSGVLTNLGKLDFSPEINTLIKRIIFIPPPPNKLIKVNCGVTGFGNELVVSFGNITTSRELEKQFFSFLIKQGMPVKIEMY